MRASAHLRAWSTLPQRIRAGCDSGLLSNCRADIGFDSAHSRGLRRCDLFPRRTVGRSLPQRIRAGCDEGSYGNGKSLSSLPQRIRAGCDQCANNLRQPDGALPQRIRAGCDCIGRTAGAGAHPLPQRIRAGCDTFPRVSLPNCFVFATAHSCGLRHGRRHGQGRIPPLCHSAFVRVATTI